MMSRASKTSHTSTRPSQSRRGFTLPLWVLGLIGIVFVGVAIFAGVVLFRVVEDFVASGPFAVAPVSSPGDAGVAENPAAPSGPEGEENPGVNPDDPASAPAGVRPVNRVTVLVMGIDRPCDQIDEPYRSDTMILLTIDPLSKTAGMISVPRDLWVRIPGFDSNRINTAFPSGEVSQYPGGGPGLAVETVELNLGIPIHHYVTVNYDAFIQAIDLIGGIELEVPETIDDPNFPDRCYGLDPFYLPAGHHFLDGETALKYARTRVTFGADFDRVGRQQAVLMAAWDKVMEQNVSLLGRSPELWNTFQENVTTDMTYQEAVGLGLVALEIPPENIHRAVIDQNYVYDYTAPDGARVLIPIRENIRELLDSFFSSTAALVPEPDLAAEAQSEAAGILVLNGTWTLGLAGDTAEYLESLGFTIAGVDDAEDKNQLVTQIIDYTGKTSTVDYLAELLHVSTGSIYLGTDPAGEYDIELLLGVDWQLPAD